MVVQENVLVYGEVSWHLPLTLKWIGGWGASYTETDRQTQSASRSRRDGVNTLEKPEEEDAVFV